MGNVKLKNGIGFSEKSGAIYIDMSAVNTVADAERERLIRPTIPMDKLAAMPWSPWGKNNLLPMEMTLDIETCAILSSIIDLLMRFGICNGVVPVVTRLDKKTGQRIIEEYVEDPEIDDFMEANRINFQSQGWMMDELGFAQAVVRYGLNRKKEPKIVKVLRHDVSEFRYSKKDNRGRINDVWFAAEWDKVRGEDDKKVFSVPHLDDYNTVADLQRQVEGGKGNEYAMTFRRPGWGKHYYSVPLWYAAIKWVKIAQGVPEMKAAIFENSIHVKYQVIIQETYWSKAYGAKWKDYTDVQKDQKRQDVWDDIDKFLVGSKNAYKSIFTTGYRDKDGNTWSDIEIKPVEDTNIDGKLLPDSAAANSEIAFAMHFNPAIFGGNQKAGLYQQESGGSSVREAGLMQVILMELERQNVRRALYIPKKFNGWDKRIPGLDFIIPATMLTTLDTGAGTKPVVTGNSKPDENAPD